MSIWSSTQEPPQVLRFLVWSIYFMANPYHTIIIIAQIQTLPQILYLIPGKKYGLSKVHIPQFM